MDADLLLRIYALGAFPMWNEEADEIHIFRPDPRAIIEFDELHVPRRLARTIRSHGFRITTDRAFDEVLDECHRRRADGCWCSPDMAVAYSELHDRGFAHSVEAWLGERLVGGLYGVHLGSAFMAESMFSRPDEGGTDASKIVLVRTATCLQAAGFTLFDVQFENEHLSQFGVVVIDDDDYVRRFEKASRVIRDWPSRDSSCARCPGRRVSLTSGGRPRAAGRCAAVPSPSLDALPVHGSADLIPGRCHDGPPRSMEVDGRRIGGKIRK